MSAPSVAAADDRTTPFGTAASEFIEGFAGNDILGGGGGNDILAGGLGNDVYYVRQGDIVGGEIGFSLGGGIDTIFTYADFTAPTNVEILRAVSSVGGISLVHNNAPGTLAGNSAANLLDGQGGNDVINGNAGNDTTIGGTGTDTMVEAAGSDVFLYRSIADSSSNPELRDVINGFTRTPTDRDRIDFSILDANSTTPVDDALTFIGTAAFAANAGKGQVRFIGLGSLNACIVDVDVDADQRTDFQILVLQTSVMESSDFVL